MSSFAMASQGPKARYYPGANSLAIFSAQGSNPLQDCKVYGKGVTKVYDKSVKGYVYSITGGLQSKLQFPKDDSKIGLQLLQSFLVLQVFVPQGVHFSFELRVSDINNTRRKMYFSTSFSDIKSTPLHCQIPISMVIRNKWLSLAFHVADLFNSCFNGSGGMNFRSIDVIVLGHVCKIRKIFTMRCRIMETNPKGYLEDASDEANENALPQEHTYAVGVDTCVQILDTKCIQSALICNRDTQDHVSNLSARKGGAKQQQQASKLDIITKAVHVAFGTRMPLPLSTVQINTNLPHDKCPIFIKDRIGKVHFVSDPAAAMATSGGGGGEANIKPTRNMLNRGLNVLSFDQEKRSLVDHVESKLRANGTNCSTQCHVEEKDHSTNTAQIGGEENDGFQGDGEPHVRAAEDGQILKLANQGLESQIAATQQESQNINADSHVEGVETSTINNSAANTTSNPRSNNTKSKWVSRRKDVQSVYAPHFKQQKTKEQRSKEYKHSRYMDTPPRSPPTGWNDITTNGGTLSEDTTFQDHFLQGTWMNNQFSDSTDGESEKMSQHGDGHGDGEDALMFDLHDDRFFPGHQSGNTKDKTELETHSVGDSFLSDFPSIVRGNGVREPYDFDAKPNMHGELDSSLQHTTHEVMTLRDLRPSTMDSSKAMINGAALSDSWDAMDSNEHIPYHISTRASSQLVDHEHEGPVKNGRPDEDLDLLYDPTLDCYYDPKTNRYYELK